MAQTSPQAPVAVPALARHIGLATLILYGVGDMVGAGIYGTIGKAAQAMGNAVWMAFVGSMLAAMFTGLSYASLASRYPRAAGAAFVTQHAYRMGMLSYIVGLTVTASGLTSMATSSNVFADTLVIFVNQVPGLEVIRPWVIVVLFIGLLTFINFWGIRESMWTNVLCTVVEVGGLLFVIAVGLKYWGSVDYFHTPATTGSGNVDLWLIASGAVLTFFSFVGFEDMLNVAEEVKRPERTMPWGMIIALIITTLLYLAISITAVSVVDYRQLGDATRGAPLQQITAKAAPWLPTWVYGAITLFAVGNTVLINYIMGSRMIYGMAKQGLLPAWLGRVHAGRRTPHFAIAVLMVLGLILAFSTGVKQLATATALLLLIVFCIVNGALIVLQRRPGEPRGAFEVPWIIPVLGVLCCGGLVAAQIKQVLASPKDNWHAPAIAGGLIVLIAVLYLVARPRPVTEASLADAEREH